MKINVLKLTTKGEFVKLWISPTVDELRRVLGGPIDNIKPFTDVQTFIRRTPNDLEKNARLDGVYGDVVFTGGFSCYLAGLTAQQMNDLINMFRKERSTNDGYKRAVKKT